ncbi:uncharacterized protein LOC124366182 isoform X3 [Homalodisca vitripennis]|uniref:uncharacterized protein LOC124366182 isoform X3 n=1 Tax=Homalodisca vitripennis TaxID=197043 RepID=UPI001EEB97BC|nr:uncharacterized protein LOC124366182 isoform X3 [Homalodisca vitripennis]
MQSTVVYLGLLSAILLSVQAVPYPGPNPYARPVANPLALPYAYPEPNCCGAGSRCGLGLCDCCGGTTCENGACNPIINYYNAFYGAPRVQGGYGNTFAY